jgi:hypothetical protein
LRQLEPTFAHCWRLARDEPLELFLLSILLKVVNQNLKLLAASLGKLEIFLTSFFQVLKVVISNFKLLLYSLRLTAVAGAFSVISFQLF